MQFAQLECIGERALAVHDQPDAGPVGVPRLRARAHLLGGDVLGRRGPAGADRAAPRPASRAPRYWREHATPTARAHPGARLERGRGARSPRATAAPTSTPRRCCCPNSASSQATDPRFTATLAAIERELKDGDWLYRYRHRDDFGQPETAFTICAFWYVNALAMAGRRDEAREHFERLLARRTRLGLLSEDIDPATGEWWGNFPQTYSLVGHHQLRRSA